MFNFINVHDFDTNKTTILNLNHISCIVELDSEKGKGNCRIYSIDDCETVTHDKIEDIARKIYEVSGQRI